MEAALSILDTLGESKPRPMTDPALLQDMKSMNTRLHQMEDSAIINMQSATVDKKHDTLIKIYSHLNHILHFIPQNFNLLGATSLRMVELVFRDRLSHSMAPLAFAYYGEIQASFGDLDSGCRFGKLSSFGALINLVGLIISVCRPFLSHCSRPTCLDTGGEKEFVSIQG